jgi:hypothetical protein
MEQYRCTPSTRGPHQLEFTLEYPLSEGKGRKNRYWLDAYFFSPYQLNVTEEQCPRDEFFGNLTSYTRYKSYTLPLTSLCEENTLASPLQRIRKVIDSGEYTREAEATLLYELRVLANVVQGQVKGRQREIREALKDCSSRPEVTGEMVDSLLNDLTTISEGLRTLEPRLAIPNLSKEVKQSFQWCDELISLRIEKACIRLYKDLKTCGSLPDCQRRCSEEATRQEKDRLERNYAAVIDPDHRTPRDGELFLYREHQLKKWAESVMYMNTAESKSPYRLGHILFGLAAAVAMAFAVIASILAAEYFPPNSFNFAIFAVLAYIFKDRIKEGLRSVFMDWIPKMVADRIQHLVDPRTGKAVGKSRERLAFPDSNRVPAEIKRIRYSAINPFRRFTPPESVLHYQKDVLLKSRKMMRNHKRLTALNEVVRLDMRRWFYRMDKPETKLTWFEGENEAGVVANRVYHIGVVVRLSSERRDDTPSLFRYRIVAARDRILRVELVSASCLLIGNRFCLH